ncbi:MAG TPA: GYD domain-containing protein [Actinomycetota bacterium]|nr:GYD domain-containing protein [Actinomycetota bacterium]
MAHYLYQAAYTSEAWASMSQNPQDRIAAVTPTVERMGGRVVGGWFAFGEYDVIAVFEFPDSVSAAAVAIAFAGGGALKAAKTTPLLTVEEAMAAMGKASGTGYQPPS